MKKVEGILFMWGETGTEGFYWALQDKNYISENGMWDYKGLICLKRGYLEIYDKENKVVWSGNLDFDYDKDFYKEYNIHYKPFHEDPSYWIKFFDHAHTGILVETEDK